MNDVINDAVIRAEGLAKTYAEGKMHTPVFDGLELSVSRGETVAIIGASGAGKSTLLHLLGGLDVPTAGEVYVAGQRMSALSDAARGALRNRPLQLFGELIVGRGHGRKWGNSPYRHRFGSASRNLSGAASWPRSRMDALMSS